MVSDSFRFAEWYVGQLDNGALDTLQRELVAAGQKIAAQADKQEKIETEVRRLEEQVRKGHEEMQGLHASVKAKENRITEMTKTLEEHTALWSTKLDTLEHEVDNALEEGYGLC